jgi:hypothetical protein
MCVALWDDLKSKISDTIRLAASGRLESLVIQRAVGPIAQSVEQRTFNPIGFESPYKYYADQF